MEDVVKRLSEQIEQEIVNKITRIRAQLGIMANSLQEVGVQLVELANNISSLTQEVKLLREEAKRHKESKKEDKA